MSPEALTQKQQEILDLIVAFLRENGYPPSIQQLCQLTGLSSTSTIHQHLTALKRKGAIQWNPSEKRSLSVCGDVLETRGVLPILGTIAAGSPLQTLSDTVEQLDLSEDLCPKGCYALRVKGISMIEDHIMDGDIVIINPKSTVRDGDVVVALVEKETATLKRIYREKTRIRLQPANAEMEPIYATEVDVQGKVEAVIRKLR